ncbi:hypothetical protein FB451DRAFT_1567502 [Mycena latifolia]|nr:hypothetical protein FB451DRAFT_1567502 [Mycena latifolia]
MALGKYLTVAEHGFWLVSVKNKENKNSELTRGSRGIGSTPDSAFSPPTTLNRIRHTRALRAPDMRVRYHSRTILGASLTNFLPRFLPNPRKAEGDRYSVVLEKRERPIYPARRIWFPPSATPSLLVCMRARTLPARAGAFLAPSRRAAICNALALPSDTRDDNAPAFLAPGVDSGAPGAGRAFLQLLVQGKRTSESCTLAERAGVTLAAMPRAVRPRVRLSAIYSVTNTDRFPLVPAFLPASVVRFATPATSHGERLLSSAAARGIFCPAVLPARRAAGLHVQDAFPRRSLRVRSDAAARCRPVLFNAVPPFLSRSWSHSIVVCTHSEMHISPMHSDTRKLAGSSCFLVFALHEMTFALLASRASPLTSGCMAALLKFAFLLVGTLFYGRSVVPPTSPPSVTEQARTDRKIGWYEAFIGRPILPYWIRTVHWAFTLTEAPRSSPSPIPHAQLYPAPERHLAGQHEPHFRRRLDPAALPPFAMSVRDSHAFVTTGPYAIVHHPSSYTDGNMTLLDYQAVIHH